jgi:hypothetical protein
MIHCGIALLVFPAKAAPSALALADVTGFLMSALAAVA